MPKGVRVQVSSRAPIFNSCFCHRKQLAQFNCNSLVFRDGGMFASFLLDLLIGEPMKAILAILIGLLMHQTADARGPSCRQIFTLPTNDLPSTIEGYNHIFNRTRNAFTGRGDANLAANFSYLNLKFNISIDQAFATYNKLFYLSGRNHEIGLQLTNATLTRQQSAETAFNTYKEVRSRFNHHADIAEKVQKSLVFTKLSLSASVSVEKIFDTFKQALTQSRRNSDLAIKLTSLSITSGLTLNETIKQYNEAFYAARNKNLIREGSIPLSEMAYEIALLKIESGKSLETILTAYEEASFSQLSGMNHTIDPLFALNITQLSVLNNKSIQDVNSLYREAYRATQSKITHQGNPELAMQLTHLSLNSGAPFRTKP